MKILEPHFELYINNQNNRMNLDLKKKHFKKFQRSHSYPL